MEEVKGKALLNVTGILMIIGGALGTVTALLSLISAISFSPTASFVSSEAAQFNNMVMFAAILSLVGGVVELVAGIFGVKASKIARSAKPCIICVAVIMLLTIISGIFSLVCGTDILSVVFRFLIGLVLPVLYFIGAYQNIKG